MKLSPGILTAVKFTALLLPLSGNSADLHNGENSPTAHSYSVSQANAGYPARAGQKEASEALLDRANTAIENKNYDQALELVTSAFDLATSLDDKETLAAILTANANIYFETAQYEAANRYYSDALDIEGLDHHLRASLLFNRGHSSAKLGRFDLANGDFLQSLEISKRLSDVYGQAYTLKALGANAQAMAKPHMAREYYMMARAKFMAAGDSLQVTHIDRHLADLALSLENLPAAIERYTSVLQEYSRIEDQPGLMRAYRGLSNALALQGKFKLALDTYIAYSEIAITLAKEQGNATTRRLQVAFDTERYKNDNQQLSSLTRSQQETLKNQRSLLARERLATILAFCVVLLIGILLFRTRQFAKKMHALATTDELTGLHNRRAILKFMRTEFERATRFSRPFSCLILDLDNFKTINDTYGHEAGDKVLIKVTKAISNSLRKSDYFGRIGGEEFLLIAPETNLGQARLLSERIRKSVAEISFPSLDNAKVTISGGLVQLTDQESWEALVGNADNALYLAKQGGRNLVETFKSALTSNSVA